MTDKNQTVIIGGGHNGLVCAAYLAKAGRKVTVLEANDQVGGAAITREFSPGFKVSAGAHLLYALDKSIQSELALSSHGLSMAANDLYTVALEESGQYLSIADGALGGPGAKADDKMAMAKFHRQMGKFAKIIWDLKHQIPPRMGTTERSDLIALAKTGLAIRRLGRDDMREFLRITGINVYDILQERFDSDLLKGVLSVEGTLGTMLGTRSNNSVFCALHRENSGEDYAIPVGGMGAVSDAMAAAAKAAGAEVRTGARVRRILLEFDTVSGVELDDGEVIRAGSVISNADPKTTFNRLLGARQLEAGFAHKVSNIRSKGCVAKLHLALKELPKFTGIDKAQSGQRLVIAPSLTYVEHAFNHAKYREYSQQPVMEITIPTIHDASLAPAGQHVLSANVQWLPYDLKEGWETGKPGFMAACMKVLERFAPGIGEQVTGSELLTPADLEAEFGMTGGHWHHAELSLDQFLMMRPVPGAAQYATPINGLYLCGAGSHPGGGVMGCAGRNAANVVIEAGK